MSEISCKTCPFFRPATDDASGESGVCHYALGGSYDTLVTIDWFCSAHPQSPGQRDRIAEIAMQGLLADEHGERGGTYRPDILAKRAYAFADAMMALRGKGR